MLWLQSKATTRRDSRIELIDYDILFLEFIIKRNAAQFTATATAQEKTGVDGEFGREYR